MPSEWERDLAVGYVVQKARLKDVGMMCVTALRGASPVIADQDRKPPDRQLLDPAAVIALA